MLKNEIDKKRAIRDGLTDIGKANGITYGLAIGDALGFPTEFMTLDRIKPKYGAGGIMDLPDPAKAGEIMEARGKLVPTLSRIKPGNRLVPIAEDFGVPSTKLPDMIRKAQAIAKIKTPEIITAQ